MHPQSTHVGCGGPACRQRAIAQIHQILKDDFFYQQAVQELRALDNLAASDWPCEDGYQGYGSQVVSKQDSRGGSLLSNQLIEAEVSDIKAHISRARQLQHPAGEGAPPFKSDTPYRARVSAELRSAVRFTVGSAPDLDKLSRERVQAIERCSEMLQPLSKALRDKFSPPHIRCTPFEHAHVALLAAIREALDLPDVDLPARLLLGALVAGDLPPTCAWDMDHKPRTLGLGFDDLRHDQWNAALARDIAERARRSDPEETAALWERTIEELDKGLCDGPWDAADLDAMYGTHCWRAMRRFGVWQNEKLRACDDAKESLHNAASTVKDRLRCQSADFPARVADMFAERIGRGVRG